MSINSLNSQLSALHISADEKITFTRQALRLSPSNFWQHAANKLQRQEYATHVYIKGSGEYKRRIIETLISLNAVLPITQIAQLVQKLTRIHFNFEKIADEGLTPLQKAIIAGRTNDVNVHLHAYINQQDNKGRTALQWAVYLGYTNISRFLITNGARATPLHPVAGPGLYQSMHGIYTEQPLVPSQRFTLSYSQWRAVNGKLADIDQHIPLVATALQSLIRANTPGGKQSVQLIVQKSAQPQLFTRYLRREKALCNISHMWQVAWDEKICYIGGSRPIQFSVMSGGHAGYYLHKMTKATSQFQAQFADDAEYNLPVLPILQDALMCGSISNHLPAEELVKRFHQGKPLILPIFFPYHSVTVLLIGEHFVLCNGGQESRKTVEIHRINPACITIETITLLTSPIHSVKEYRKRLFIDIPRQFHFYKTAIERQLEILIDAPAQKTQNCSWHSSKIAVYTLFMLHMIQSLASFSSTTILNTTYVERLINRRTIIFLNWDLLQRLSSLQKAINNPDRDFVTNNTMLPKITIVFQNIQKQSWPHPLLLSQMRNMALQYPALKSSN